MEGTHLNPYLQFDGNAREAMEAYAKIFGGELTTQTYGEAGQPGAEGDADRIMHAHLEAGSLILMASDAPPHGDPVSIGTNVSLSVVGSDEAALKANFDALAEGGAVMVPLEKQFWGDTFGMCTDRFGVQWMVNINAEA